ncbi:ABC transporter ATP-binding protein [Achromobacter xylosoxidans]|uniref:ABC transporter ATP-binding protein n=1 Tax=Achromobacter TaxID=222 RepID=UPI001563EB69|nr:ABC transporter ATP-binding protein [Achromobacter xylosoxidans]QKI70415.1 ATP-binding cassette domain-containing protein [Achromobacter xylosoxidans]
MSISGKKTAAILCEDVAKTFVIENERNMWRLMLGLPVVGRTFKALQNVSMAVPKGKIVAILGHNGAGKSTLLRILGGVYQPTHGVIQSDGTISGLFEMGGTGGRQLTGRAYALRYFSLMGVPKRERQALLEDIREFSELDENFERPIYSYSTGMAARLYFATATALRHDIYLIDELLSVGDEHFQAKCWIRMRNLLLSGASGVLVTHDWVSALKLCEQSHILSRGQLSPPGPTDEMVVKYLDLPRPSGEQVRFRADNPHEHHAVSGEDARLVMDIEISRETPITLVYSIEMLRVGIGWEVLLLGNSPLQAHLPGKHRVELKIDALPLAPGEYSLNLGLIRSKGSASEETEAFDARGWTTGNGYRLIVSGTPTGGATVLPLTMTTWDET